jgi:hypothetical protein
MPVGKEFQPMLVLIFWTLFFVVLAVLALRYGADSRPGVNERQLDWSVRLS